MFFYIITSRATYFTLPIILTALAAMLDVVFILDVSIFNGLAIPLVFGMLIFTALTLVERKYFL